MKRYTVLLIGYGNMGREWAKVLARSKSVSLIGVADMLPENRNRAIDEMGLQPDQVAENLQSLIGRTTPDIVLDCSPPFAHLANTTLALEHGCHVLGEKPISLDFAAASNIVRAAKQAGKVYMINQNYRWHPMVKALRDYLAPRPLGSLHSINISYSQNFLFNDTFRYTMDHPLLTDMAVHHFDLVRSITGATHEQVYCHEFNPSGSRFKSGSSAVAIFEMSDHTTFSYQGSWSDIGESQSFVGSWRIACENGTLFWDGINSPEVETMESDVVTRKELSLIDAAAHPPETIFPAELESSLDALINAIADGTQPETWCGDNIGTLDMVLSAITSAEQHTTVTAHTDSA